MRSRRFSFVRYLAVLLLFTLGLMAKPMLVTLPFMLLLLDYWPLGRMAGRHDSVESAQRLDRRRRASGARRASVVRLIVEKLPLLALVAGSCALTLWAQREVVVSYERPSVVLADRQRPGFLRGLPAAVLLADWLGAVVSACRSPISWDGRSWPPLSCWRSSRRGL